MSLLDFSKFEYKFGSWAPKIKPFFDSGEMDRIFAQLKQLGREGKKIAPASDYVFRCFKETPLEDLKVVMMGLSPYHTMKGGQFVANGLLMATDTEETPPSLFQFYNGMEEELYDGLNLHMSKTNDLSYLARRGVLLFNTSLTCEIGKPGSHLKIWEPFTKFILEQIVAYTGAPVVFLGVEAAKFRVSIAPFQWSFTVSHPASASYKGDRWSSEGVFSKVNKVLSDEGKSPIKWVLEHTDDNGHDYEDLPF